MGGLRKKMPWTFWTSSDRQPWPSPAFPSSPGFFSKDEILWLAYPSHHGPRLLALYASGCCADHRLLHVPARLPHLLRRGRADQVHLHIHEPHERGHGAAPCWHSSPWSAALGGRRRPVVPIPDANEPSSTSWSPRSEPTGPITSHSTEYSLAALAIAVVLVGDPSGLDWLYLAQARASRRIARVAGRALPRRLQQVLRGRDLRRALRPSAGGDLGQGALAASTRRSSTTSGSTGRRRCQASPVVRRISSRGCARATPSSWLSGSLRSSASCQWGPPMALRSPKPIFSPG